VGVCWAGGGVLKIPGAMKKGFWKWREEGAVGGGRLVLELGDVLADGPGTLAGALHLALEAVNVAVVVLEGLHDVVLVVSENGEWAWGCGRWDVMDGDKGVIDGDECDGWGTGFDGWGTENGDGMWWMGWGVMDGGRNVMDGGRDVMDGGQKMGDGVINGGWCDEWNNTGEGKMRWAKTEEKQDSQWEEGTWKESMVTKSGKNGSMSSILSRSQRFKTFMALDLNASARATLRKNVKKLKKKELSRAGRV
jgi:hypothetical protein